MATVLQPLRSAVPEVSRRPVETGDRSYSSVAGADRGNGSILSWSKQHQSRCAPRSTAVVWRIAEVSRCPSGDVEHLQLAFCEEADGRAIWRPEWLDTMRRIREQPGGAFVEGPEPDGTLPIRIHRREGDMTAIRRDCRRLVEDGPAGGEIDDDIGEQGRRLAASSIVKGACHACGRQRDRRDGGGRGNRP